MGKRLAVAAVSLATAVGTATPVLADERATVRVKLQVISGRFSADVIEGAKAEAGRVFEHAGVDISWVDASHKEGYDLVMIVVASPRGATPSSALGAARETAMAGYVFHDRVQTFSRQFSVSLEFVVGHVLAHEIGHLLLADRSHTNSGLMRAGWDSKDVEQMKDKSLLFLREQGMAIRASLAGLSATLTN